MIELALLLLGLGSTEFTVTVRDSVSGQPVDGAFVVAREFTTVGQFHGSRTYCIRADVTLAAGPRVAMQLPHAGTASFSGARAIEAFAYRPGYCLARTGDGAAASRALYGPSYDAVRAKGLDPSSETRLEMRRSPQVADDRLHYLGEMARLLVCGEPRWSDRGREGFERLSSAMITEAQGIARNRYEKSLVETMKGTLVAARELKADAGGRQRPLAIASPQMLGFAGGHARDFIVGHPSLRVSWDDSRRMAIAALPAQEPQAARTMAMPAGALQAARPGSPGVVSSGGAATQVIVAQPKITVTAGPPPLAIHCRHGAPSACDLNERDAQGVTALQAYVGTLKIPEVKALLDAGADPSVPAKPSGVPPVEMLLERMLRTQPRTGEAKDAAELLEMLAAHPMVTLSRRVSDDLAADPSKWNLAQQSPGRTLLVEARERLRTIPVHAEEPSCAPLGGPLGPVDYGGPMRLRLRYP